MDTAMTAYLLASDQAYETEARTSGVSLTMVWAWSSPISFAALGLTLL